MEEENNQHSGLTPVPSVKRGRGRPKGSKTKRVYLPHGDRPPPQPYLVPPPNSEIRDFRHADPMTMLDRQFSILDWAQQALRNEITKEQQSKGQHIAELDIRKLLDLSNALARTIEALKKHQDMAEELARRMTPEQLLEAALKKIEGQDINVLNYAIKRLRAYRERIAPVKGVERISIGYEEKATDAIASLETDEV